MKKLTLDELKQEEIKVLDSFVKYCEDNGLRYYLAYGTLIGAIRHKGYIPWDDDIDILMPRPDYEKLITILPDSELYNSDGVLLKPFYYRFNNLAYPFLKICSTNTVVHEQRFEMNSSFGVWIDVFPMDGMPKGKYARKIHIKSCDNILKMLEQTCVGRDEGSNTIVRAVRRILYPLLHLINTYKFAALCDKHACKYDYESSLKVASKLDFLKHTYWDRDWFSDIVKVEFEGKVYNAPVGYDQYLRTVYGDYMQLPPKEKRKIHIVDVDWIEN